MCILLPPKRIKLQPIKEEIDDLTLPKWVTKLNYEDELCKEICEYLTNPNNLKKPDIFCKDLKVDNELILRKQAVGT